MIYINCKFKTVRLSTGVQRVASAYHQYMHRHHGPVADLDYRTAGKLGNLEEQAMGMRRFERSDVVLHPANTAPLRKLAAFELLVLHDMIFMDFPESYSRAFLRWYRYLIPRIAESKDHIITVSEFSRQRICALLGIEATKITVIPNGVDEKFFAGRKKQAQSGNAPKPFLTVGSPSARKRVNDIITAHQRLPSEMRRDHPLHIIGGNTGIFTKAGLNTGRDDHIILCGYIDDEDLVSTYANGLALITASEYEGFGLPVLEAFASGLHVIASGIPPHREILGGDYEAFFPPGNIDALTEVMVNTVKERESLNSKESVKERKALAGRFAWDKTLKEIGSLIGNAQTRVSE